MSADNLHSAQAAQRPAAARRLDEQARRLQRFKQNLVLAAGNRLTVDTQMR